MRISHDLQAWLRKRAKKLNTTPSGFVRQVLETLKEWEEGVGK